MKVTHNNKGESHSRFKNKILLFLVTSIARLTLIPTSLQCQTIAQELPQINTYYLRVWLRAASTN